MKIGVVLVTFNRLADLKKTIRLYEQQSHKPAYILAVDNHSTDGTAEFLAQWMAEESDVEHKLITLAENTGGSGGFYAGTKAAAELAADWIWLADDDAYIEPDAFEKFRDFLACGAVPEKDVAALSAAVCNKSGYSNSHRSRNEKTLFGYSKRSVADDEYQKAYFEIDYYSFVGALIKKDVLIKAGFPEKGYFIYHDDYEHAERVRKYGKILCIPEAKVFHEDNSNATREASWRDYYATRNLLLLYKKHYGNSAFYRKAVTRFLSSCLSMNPEKIRLFWVSIQDANKEVTGLHSIYRPGWQPTKKYPKK